MAIILFRVQCVDRLACSEPGTVLMDVAFRNGAMRLTFDYPDVDIDGDKILYLKHQYY